jgi:hypothetical protein
VSHTPKGSKVGREMGDSRRFLLKKLRQCKYCLTSNSVIVDYDRPMMPNEFSFRIHFSDSDHDAADDEDRRVRLRVLRLRLPRPRPLQFSSQVTMTSFEADIRGNYV